MTKLGVIVPSQEVPLPQLVSSLPSGPTDGTEVYFYQKAAAADASAVAMTWHFRYRAFDPTGAVPNPNAQKWEFIGGAPYRGTILTSETTISTTYGDLATVGPQVTPQANGLYYIRIGCEVIVPATSGATVSMSFDSGSGGSDTFRVVATTAAAVAVTFSLEASPPIGQLLSAGSAVVAKYKTSTGTATFKNRFLELIPIALT